MTILPEIREIIDKNMELMLNQTKAYLPFLRISFPNVKDLPEMCYNLIEGNALTTFLAQYGLGMKSPDEKDFSEFGTLVEKYRIQVKEMF